MNVHVANRIVELLKILPTREFEFNFLADYLMTINQLLQSYRHFEHITNLELLLTNLSDALKYYILPFLMETGFANMEDSKSCQNTPKFYFLSRFLEALTTMT